MLPAGELERIYRDACEAELRAFKPGNVSQYSAGHGMTVEDFLRSARASAPALARAGATVGQRVLGAIEATHGAVGCNTNLGIVLLAAPLLAAVESGGGGLRRRLQRVLAGLDVEDCRQVYRAIRLAAPAGMGDAGEADIAEEPAITLREAMALAAGRDSIAAQYVNGYAEVLGTGVATLREWPRRAPAALRDPRWATVACYLRFMSMLPDSHVLRKFGLERAKRLQMEAKRVENAFGTCQNCPDAEHLLRQLDDALKREGINPGTSADLTVASLMAERLEALIQQERRSPRPHPPAGDAN